MGIRVHYKQYKLPLFFALAWSALLKEEKALAQLSSESGVSTNQLTRWKNYALTEMPRLFERKTDKPEEKYETKTTELYAEIGRLTTQVNWLNLLTDTPLVCRLLNQNREFFK